MRTITTPAMLAALVITLTTIAACGDDEPGATAATSPAPASAAAGAATTAAATAASIEPEVCAVAAEINASEGPPTVELLERYRDAAPAELRAPTEIVIDALAAADGDFMAVFSDPAAAAAIEEITAIEAELCGSQDDRPAQDPSVTVVDAAATRVDVVATEHAFEAELPSTPGRYSFVMSNAGQQPHLMILVRLEDGAVLDEMLTSQGDAGVAEEYESSLAVPGGEGVVTADLGPGRWVLVCPIPGEGGRPHFADGMIEEFTIA